MCVPTGRANQCAKLSIIHQLPNYLTKNFFIKPLKKVGLHFFVPATTAGAKGLLQF